MYVRSERGADFRKAAFAGARAIAAVAFAAVFDGAVDQLEIAVRGDTGGE